MKNKQPLFGISIIALLCVCTQIFGMNNWRKEDTFDHALRHAVFKEDVAEVKKLLEGHDKLTHSFRANWNHLHFAAVIGNREIMNMLLERSVCVNAYSHRALTPLALAICWGNIEMVDLLLKHNASLEIRFPKKLLPLYKAQIKANPLLAQRLKEYFEKKGQKNQTDFPDLSGE